MKSTIFLFGEAEKGEFGIPLSCSSLTHLLESLGSPPNESLGIHFAVQGSPLQKKAYFLQGKRRRV